jgi:TolA-binding protein
VYVPNAHYEIGAAYFVLNDYKNALVSYQVLASKYGFSPKAPEAMLGIADCHRDLKDIPAAKKALKQLVARYPGSEAAIEAKKRLAKSK